MLCNINQQTLRNTFHNFIETILFPVTVLALNYRSNVMTSVTEHVVSSHIPTQFARGQCLICHSFRAFLLLAVLQVCPTRVAIILRLTPLCRENCHAAVCLGFEYLILEAIGDGYNSFMLFQYPVSDSFCLNLEYLIFYSSAFLL